MGSGPRKEGDHIGKDKEADVVMRLDQRMHHILQEIKTLLKWVSLEEAWKMT